MVLESYLDQVDNILWLFKICYCDGVRESESAGIQF